MISIPATRADLALMVPRGGIIIELGVAAGRFAAEMLTANPHVEYLGVDRWSDHHDKAEMDKAIERLTPWGHLATLCRDTFAAHVCYVPDAWADLIYVDGYAHTGQEGGQTLEDWLPKVRHGGIIAGHDYDATHYPQTVEAVDRFIERHALSLRIIEEEPHPSWWCRVP